MISVVEWLAPAATMLAAIMTASNLGARITGWGFVVFTIGSVGWVVLGVATDQTSLIVANGFLTAVNVIGIWRWLGRQARYEAVGEAAEAAGAAPVAVSGIPASGLIGRTVTDDQGEPLAKIVEVILDRQSGALAQLVVRFGGVGGVGEQLVALLQGDFSLSESAVTTRLSASKLASLPRLDKPLAA